MFVLHSSNKTENLVAHLATIIRSAPLASPLAQEVLLIQSQGMERWLSQQLASQLGVWGNYQFFFPNKFFSSLAQQIGLSLCDAAFDRDKVAWRLEALLRDPSIVKKAKPLEHYLQGTNLALKRFQLALQLAQLFDQYQIMRPDLLAAWERGELFYHSENEIWQKTLWLAIVQATGLPHRGQLWQAVIGKLNAAKLGEFGSRLPERISVFGVNTMPPLFMAYLQALSQHCQVHFFLLNPAQVFWAELIGKRQRLVEGSAVDSHPLLTYFGQQGREFQALLLEQMRFELELESFEENDGNNSLQRLQNDLLNNRIENKQLANDGSISLHACHSRLREVEVLKDLLLQALQEDPSLALRDIVVMAPDIQDYEPFISAVFDGIPHAIADRSLRQGNKLLDIFVQFLQLSQGRYGWREVLDVLEQPAVYGSFGLSEADLELIAYWLQGTRIRWGRSAGHKREFGLPETSENTWQATLDRLMAGYAVGDDDEFVDGILPYPDIEGLSAAVLGGLNGFMQLLFMASDELKQARPRQAWTELLYGYADKLFGSAEAGEREVLNGLLIELSDDLPDTADTDRIGRPDHESQDLVVIASWLKGKMDERKSSNGFLRGQLTFCSMLPMRSIPFQVIALMGLNEGQFPKLDKPATFDLLANHYRPGDRSRRADDRYQFLEILLSARQRLMMTYIGQSISSNEAIPPSVVVGELLDVLQNDYGLDNLTTYHRLHAFSPHYFSGDKGLFSYSTSNLAIAEHLNRKQSDIDQPAVWWLGSTPYEPEAVIELHELLAFFRNPQKHFFDRQLGIRFQSIEAVAEEREPFVPEFLDQYQTLQDWVSLELVGKGFSAKKLQAQGRWPSGPLGELEYAKQQPLVDQFVQTIKAMSPLIVESYC